MSRSLWFAAGAGAGVYVASRARRALDSLSAEGLRNRWHGLTHAARVAGEEMHVARTGRETELRERFGLAPGTAPELAAPGSSPTRLSTARPATPRDDTPVPDPSQPDLAEQQLLPADDTRDRT